MELLVLKDSKWFQTLQIKTGEGLHDDFDQKAGPVYELNLEIFL